MSKEKNQKYHSIYNAGCNYLNLETYQNIFFNAHQLSWEKAETVLVQQRHYLFRKGSSLHNFVFSHSEQQHRKSCTNPFTMHIVSWAHLGEYTVIYKSGQASKLLNLENNSQCQYEYILDFDKIFSSIK